MRTKPRKPATEHVVASGRSERSFQALTEIGRLITLGLDELAMLRQITEALARLLDCPYARLWKIDEQGELELVAAAGPLVPANQIGLRRRIGTATLNASVLASGRIYQTCDVESDSRWFNREISSGQGLHTYVGVPLLMGERRFGILTLLFRGHVTIDGEDMRLIETVSAQAAIALAHAEEFRRSQRRADRLAELNAISHWVVSSLDRDETLNRIVTAGQRLVDGAYAGLWLLDEAETELVQVGSTAANMLDGDPRRLPVERSMFGTVLRSKRPIRTDDVMADPRFHSRAFAEREGLAACVAVPVLDAERPVGVLAVMAPATCPFTSEDTELLQVLAGFSASVIANASAHAAIGESARRLRTLYQALACGIIVFDTGRRILHANATAEEIVGLSLEELRALDADALVMRDEDGLPFAEGRSPLQIALNDRQEIRDWTAQVVRPDGQQRWLQFNIMPVAQSTSHTMQAVLTFVDVTERKLAQVALARREERFRALVQNGAEIILIVDSHATITYSSPSTDLFLESNSGAAKYCRLLDQVHPDDVDTARGLLERAHRMGDENVTEAFRLRHRDGSWRHLEAVCRNLSDVPEVGGVVLNLRDVTERKQLEEQLAHRAYHDVLTDLPNRALLSDRLNGALARAERTRRTTALLFMDLDDFKVVNDSLGHDIGDQLLVNVAQRLHACVRPSDVIGRLGGDEFIVLLEDLSAADEASVIAERILQLFASPFILHGRTVYVSGSIGIAVARENVSADDLLRDADIAMYAAKNRGKGRWQVFEPGMNAPSLERLELEADLRQALEGDELCLYYQPIIDLQTDEVRGVEALVRWRHPRRGLVPPLDFIPIAEETGLIVPIGRWILREACRQARLWDKMHPSCGPLSMSVNISSRQFQDAGLVEDVRQALHAEELPPHRLRLEVTESVAMDAGLEAIEKLQALRGLGIQLVIDDFGTGYSSLAYLKRFPIDGLKIDRSFVDGLGQDLQDTAIVGSVLAIARSLKLTVTAEGVETPEQLAALRDLQCAEAQGYYFARPQPAAAISKLFLTDTTDLQIAA